MDICVMLITREGFMGKEKNIKNILIREKIFKAIAMQPGDIDTIKERLRKQKVAESRTKINNAIDQLLATGRLILKNKQLTVNENSVKQGRYVRNNGISYVLIEGDSKQHYLGRDDAVEDLKNNSRVNIGFYFKPSKNGLVEVPFVIGEDKTMVQQDELLSSLDPTIVYGRVMKTSHDNLVFMPNDKKRFKHPIVICNDKKTLAKYQDKICTMKIVDPESENKQAVGLLLEIKGQAGNPIAEYDAIAESHGANMSFEDPKVKAEIAKLPTEVDLSNYHLVKEDEKYEGTKDNRETIIDLRDLNFTTTDPATCKDMDDAIYSTFDEKGNIVVYTAVANVTKYVNLNSEIGKRYIKAGFTTYAPNKAYNILPPELSTNICSLNPNVDRLAFVVKTVVDPKTGKPISSTLLDSVIQSKEKFSYEQAQEICDDEKNKDITYESLKTKVSQGEELSREEQVILNKYASDILWKGLNSRNLLQFDSNNEYDVTFNEAMDDIVDITKQPHIPYHKVIEAFMVTANEATAEYALKNGLPNIYRVHGEPNEDKLAQAYEFFGYLNMDFDGDLSPMGIKKLIADVKGKPQEKVVNNFLIRLQSKAKYCNTTNPKDVELIGKPERRGKSQTQNKKQNRSKIEFKHETKSTMSFQDSIDAIGEKSHFGLQSDHYSHTTSPIRRITDYITHYNILAHIKGKKLLDEDKVRDIALWANQMQDAVDSSEKEFDELNGAIYCEHHKNEKMRGRICSFRKLADSKNLGIEDIAVVVENEEKGIRVQLPLVEVLASKNCTTKNVAISQFGSAVVNKNTNAPILTVCQDLTFRVAEANRVTRVVLGTMGIARENEEQREERETDDFDTRLKILREMPIGSSGMSSKKERMLKNTAYCKLHQNDAQARLDDQSLYGIKFKNQIQFREYAEAMENVEAYRANKEHSRKHRERKRKEEIDRQLQDYENGDYED